jgi:hypothetical protein
MLTHIPQPLDPQDISTCIDHEGHGTHTASTAGGDYNALPSGNGLYNLQSGMSGMAPGAAVVSYKVRARGAGWRRRGSCVVMGGGRSKARLRRDNL